MAKSVSDLVLVTEMLHTESARSKLPENRYLSFLTNNFSGLKGGFLDELQWYFAATTVSTDT